MATQTLETVVPMVSSGTPGPLGAIHLPRLWSKLTLAAAGLLPGDYDECGAGFDQMTLTDLGLDRQKTIDFVRTQKPTYMKFEEWVVANGKTDPETIRKHNEAIRGYNHSDQLAGDMQKASGLKQASIKDAVTLNMIEDLDALHQQVTGK